MRLATFTLVGALALMAAALPASAAPLAPGLTAQPAAAIIQVRGGCGWGFHPVPGHWNRFRGWIPPHCARNWGPYGPHAAWRWHHHYW